MAMLQALQVIQPASVDMEEASQCLRADWRDEGEGETVAVFLFTAMHALKPRRDRTAVRVSH
jgi:hypothetical protein